MVCAVIVLEQDPYIFMSIKLTYFDMGGRALAARLALTIGGIPFEDERLQAWGEAERSKAPFGELPYMELKPTPAGVPAPFSIAAPRLYSQSHAINRFCASVAKLNGNNILDTLAIDQATMQMEDIYTHFTPTMFIADPAVKKTKREEFLSEVLIPNLHRLEQLLTESGTGYFGESLSVADLVFLGVYRHFTGGDVDHVPATVVDAFPKLTALHAKVAALPVVVAFFKLHPDG